MEDSVFGRRYHHASSDERLIKIFFSESCYKRTGQHAATYRYCSIKNQIMMKQRVYRRKKTAVARRVYEVGAVE
jgi:hypothetical protein